MQVLHCFRLYFWQNKRKWWHMFLEIGSWFNKADKLSFNESQFGNTMPRSLKSVLVLPSQILGPFGPPKKRVNFNMFQKHQKCVFCVLTPNHLINYRCPTVFYSINKAEIVLQLFGPPKCLWSSGHATHAIQFQGTAFYAFVITIGPNMRFVFLFVIKC